MSARRVARSAVVTAIGILLFLVLECDANAAVRRFALLVGNNTGDAGEVPLKYAESDAMRVHDVLKDLGGFEPADMVLLRGENAARVQSSIITLNDRIRSVVGGGSEAILFVFYSGHGGEGALHLSGTRLPLPQLEQLIRGSAATFRVFVVDACRSGALTRVKGGTSTAPFDIRVDERLAGQGVVFLTSTSGAEDAQESDALKGSFFTHHLVSGLLGAADVDGDGRVSLEEAYRHAYDATLRSSSETFAGLQHPSFRYELHGAGRVVLTELRANATARGTLSFPANKTYLVLEKSAEGRVVAEVSRVAAARRISVSPGRYFVRGRAPDVLLEGEIAVTAGATIAVEDDRLRRVAYARLVRKGEAGTRRVAHGPEAGFAFHTPLPNANTLCHGAFAGYALHLEEVSFGARLSGCHASYRTSVIEASADELAGELRASHSFDLPVLSLEVGAGVGAAVLSQRFSTRGDAPARTTPAGTAALLAGLRLDIAAGFSIFGQSSVVAFVYAQERAVDGAKHLGPHLAFRQELGLAKLW